MNFTILTQQYPKHIIVYLDTVMQKNLHESFSSFFNCFSFPFKESHNQKKRGWCFSFLAILRCLGKKISPNCIREPCGRLRNMFRWLQIFLKPHYSISMCSPLGHMKSSQVEFLVLLSSATNLTYFFLERGHSSSFEHFFPPLSLLSKKLQLILATENFTDTSCMKIFAD